MSSRQSTNDIISIRDCAKLIYDSNKNIKVINIKSQIWYKYNNTIKLWQKLSHNEIAMYVKKQLDIMNSIQKENNVPRNFHINVSSAVASNVASELMLMCYDSKFGEQLDVVKHKLPLKNNKVINLKTEIVSERTIDDMFTYELDVEYTYQKTNNAINFLNKLMGNDQTKIKELQKCLGYCITGEYTNANIFAFVNNSNNILMSMLYTILNNIFDKKITVSNKLLKSFEYKNKHLAICITSEDKYKNKTDLFNFLNFFTDTGMIYGRELFSEMVQFRLKCKPIFLVDTNTKDMIDKENTDFIEKQRLYGRSPVPKYNVTYIEFNDNQDSCYDLRISDELLSEIFTWIAHGSIMWYREKRI
jgi:hypothetical protein